MSLRYEQAETLLNAIGLYAVLAEFDPTFVGTLPLDVDIAGSDVDVICRVADPARFAAILTDQYGDQPDFLVVPEGGGKAYTLCRFSCVNFAIEIFGQNKPVTEQHAYLHLQAERKLLTIGGEAAREAIRALKRSGVKTEPAFAQYFKLDGEPYQRLLELAPLSLSDILSELD